MYKCPAVVQPPGTEAAPPHHIGHMESVCPTYSLVIDPSEGNVSIPQVYTTTPCEEKHHDASRVLWTQPENYSWSGLIEAGL